ncbi:hypothetical protein TSAR_003858 [Trichomalopsis sarcophagae]|uniref:Endonuclease/exonuclease/phosphatase domain-containing protein n=1 Tax=Trichomalopsis sarcophagae TaxID=543379 RepID=A0A232EL37_9HYME|nr:hypothetical protein TSAR_003858 [Trichomalopsis sarcophagae]
MNYSSDQIEEIVGTKWNEEERKQEFKTPRGFQLPREEEKRGSYWETTPKEEKGKKAIGGKGAELRQLTLTEKRKKRQGSIPEEENREKSKSTNRIGVEFEDREEKEKIMKAKSNLKGTDFIDHDTTWLERRIKEKLNVLAKEWRNQGKQVKETWTGGGEEENIRKRLQGYEVKVREAKKGGSRLGLKGVMIMAVKKRTKEDKVEWMEGRSGEFVGGKIRIKGKEWWIGSTFMREEKRNNYKKVEEMVERAGGGGRILWCGDLNARTETEGGSLDE